ncbi:hypothetical protein BJX63DRAFT_443829 [Aspergillus granulosus]|uniref:Chitin-binding type-1 domain-containing protein n=1 Tax=Aspergillus granulosus TaxID=176169 RepID=A0ABR4H9D4_9EURO
MIPRTRIYQYPPSPPDPTPTPSDCTGDKCGRRECILFGCDGGCSIFGCGGGCGTRGCIPDCLLRSCGRLGCLLPGGCGNTQGSDGGDSSNECDSPATASACTYLVTSYSAWYLASSSTTTEDTTVTTTPGSPQCSIDPDVSKALSVELAVDVTMINGEQVPIIFAPTNPPDYDGSTFTKTQLGLQETLTVIQTVTVTNTPTTTVTVVVPPSATADCAYWTTSLFYIFEKLKDEEKGCGALTGWDWNERTSTHLSRAYFNLPVLMKAGCVERAIVSAGGPKLSCDYQGHTSILNGKRSMEIKPPARALPLRRQLISETASLPSLLPTTESYTSTENPPLYTPESWGPGNRDFHDYHRGDLKVDIYHGDRVRHNEASTTGTPTSTTTSAIPPTPSNPSTDGLCGAANGGQTCLGSSFGDCCSGSDYCGDTAEYCGTGCQPEFGTYWAHHDPVGAVCEGSAFGDCCSEGGYCGDMNAYCGTGCQEAFGSFTRYPNYQCR